MYAQVSQVDNPQYVVFNMEFNGSCLKYNISMSNCRITFKYQKIDAKISQ